MITSIPGDMVSKPAPPSNESGPSLMHGNDHARPSFDLRQLPSILRHNTRNRVTYFREDGTERARSFAEVDADARRVLARLRASGLRMDPGARAVIAGQSGYPWLLAALACLFAGVEIVALPETLGAEDAACSLASLACDFALTDARMDGHPVFAALPRVRLEGLGSLPEDAPPAEVDRCPRWSIVAFTSGSTSSARLKSFRIAPDSTAAFIDAFTATFGIEPTDLWLVCHPFTHIVHFEYVLGGLGWGYDIALCDPVRVVLNGAALRPSVLVSVPSVYEQIANQIRRRLPKSGARRDEITRLLEEDVVAGQVSSPLWPEAAAVLGDRLKVLIIGAAPSSSALRRFLQVVGLPLFEGYGMSETNMIACNHPRRSRPGSVGPIWPGVEVSLTDEGVVLARPTVQRTGEYLNVSPQENAETFLAEGWVSTGDLGRIEDDCLFVTGRKKEIIVSDSAKKINVASIEARLRDISGVGQALVFGDRRPFLVAVFAPPPDAALPPSEEIRAQLHPINAQLPYHERLLDFLRLEEPFTVENGLLTRSGKARRLVVAERFGGAIARLYDKDGSSGPIPVDTSE